MRDKLPKISVVTITYGHEHYITETLDGVLMQEYGGAVEFIIANDNSPDNTDELVKNYFKENPAPENFEIKYTRHAQNKGMMPNFIWALEQAEGKYIALCEGDDYWTDPLKLQKQVDFLNSNPSYSACFHSVTKYQQVGGNMTMVEIPESGDFPANKNLLANKLHTASFVFRREYLLESTLFNNKKTIGGDRLLVLSLAERGKLYFMKDNMAVYRIHDGGVSNSLNNKDIVSYNKRFIAQYLYIAKTFKSQKHAARIKIVDHVMAIVVYYYKKKNPKALLYLGFAIYHKPSLIASGIKKLISRYTK